MHLRQEYYRKAREDMPENSSLASSSQEVVVRPTTKALEVDNAANVSYDDDGGSLYYH